ncbi:Iron-sulfur clusters transporter atm1 [Diplonema papillatum]|nr:Iron-sulfur clusters transporter atm1 [Diplonema papillatum]KAJ9458078.1 Iron-sulfur clusters transporter atm1 [Diplonema papillatum]KAJ9458079.1 Iron-sulfur clusters transporter atm1 [Diplonema papillatum]KAJ9458080.1 Iron-sulfur clusters transporter atm1 [Diplonema papillatum]
MHGGGRKAVGGDAQVVKAPPNMWCLRVLLAVTGVGVAVGMAVWAAELAGTEMRDYSVRSSVVDMVFHDVVKAVALGVLLLKKELSGTYFALLSSTAVVASKCIVFEWSSARGSAVAVLVVSVSVMAIQLMLVRPAVGTERKKIPTFGVLVKILKPYFAPKGWVNKMRAFATYACIAGNKVCNLLLPLILGAIISDLTSGSLPYAKIGQYCGLAFAAKVLKEAQNVIYVKVKQTAFIEMAGTVFAHMHNLSLEWHLRKKMGDVIRSMDRGTAAADTVVTYLFLYLFPTILECITTFIIFSQHYKQPEVAAICLLSFSLYLIITYALTVWRKKFREGMNQHDNDYHNKATDSLVNFETVKYFTAEERELESFTVSVAQYQKFGVRIQASLSALNLTQQFIIYACTAGVMLVGAHQVHIGRLSVGDFVAINSYVLQLFTPLTFLGTVYNTVVMSFVNMQHLAELLSQSPDIQDVPGARPLALPYDPFVRQATAVNVDDDDAVPAPQQCHSVRGVDVEFRDVHFRYPSADAGAGIHGISFRAEAGQKVALVGPTGSGKTTLSRLLFRFYDCGSGAIYVHGQDIAKAQQSSVRKAIGIVPQDTVLFNDTIRNNVLYGNPHATDEELLQAVRDAKLDDVIERLPDKWETSVGERGLRLSGGEKQRVAIARCLLKDPPVIVLDEATSALDSTTEKSVLDVLQCLAGRTLLVIAHRLSTIQDSDLILVLKDGTIRERGTHESLRSMPDGIYNEMWRNQETRTLEASQTVSAEAE